MRLTEYLQVWLIFLPLVTYCMETVINTATIGTKLGPIEGVETSVPGTSETCLQYRRVPFAKPPVGQLRFSKPEPYGSWKGTLDATEFGPSCVQQEFFTDLPNKDMSEDCLFLNVFVHNSSQDHKRSVMVWLHGGGYAIGQGMFYNASILATTGNVIVVTVNYRLGVFGFLTLGSAEARGNYGLWDQIQALKWINENIEEFGGDRGSVTVFGGAAGAFSASLLSIIPTNKGLFHRVIAQSGTALSPYALSPASISASTMVAESVGCRPNSVMTCLRDKGASELLNAALAVPTHFLSASHFHLAIGIGPVVDGELILDDPQKLVSNSYPEAIEFLRSLDFMTGITNAEGSILNLIFAPPLIQEKHNLKWSDGISTEIFKNLIVDNLVSLYYQNKTKIRDAIVDMYTDYTSLAAQSMRAVDMFGDVLFVAPAMQTSLRHSINNNISQSYHYLMSRVSPIQFVPPPSWFTGSSHGDELFYLFGMKIKQLQGINVVEEDLVLAKQIMQYWSNFAKTGNPNLPKIENLPVWPKFEPSTQLYLELNSPIAVKDRLKTAALEFWTKTIPEMTKTSDHILQDEKDEL